MHSNNQGSDQTITKNQATSGAANAQYYGYITLGNSPEYVTVDAVSLKNSKWRTMPLVPAWNVTQTNVMASNSSSILDANHIDSEEQLIFRVGDYMKQNNQVFTALRLKLGGSTATDMAVVSVYLNGVMVGKEDVPTTTGNKPDFQVIKPFDKFDEVRITAKGSSKVSIHWGKNLFYYTDAPSGDYVRMRYAWRSIMKYATYTGSNAQQTITKANDYSISASSAPNDFIQISAYNGTPSGRGVEQAVAGDLSNNRDVKWISGNEELVYKTGLELFNDGKAFSGALLWLRSRKTAGTVKATAYLQGSMMGSQLIDVDANGAFYCVNPTPLFDELRISSYNNEVRVEGGLHANGQGLSPNNKDRKSFTDNFFFLEDVSSSSYASSYSSENVAWRYAYGASHKFIKYSGSSTKQSFGKTNSYPSTLPGTIGGKLVTGTNPEYLTVSSNVGVPSVKQLENAVLSGNITNWQGKLQGNPDAEWISGNEELTYEIGSDLSGKVFHALKWQLKGSHQTSNNVAKITAYYQGSMVGSVTIPVSNTAYYYYITFGGVFDEVSISAQSGRVKVAGGSDNHLPSGPGYTMNRFYLKDAPSSSSKRIFADNADDNSSNTITSSYTLNVFPNPATDVVNITMDNEELRVIRLLDMNGRILSESYDKGHFHSINVSNLDNGTYIIQIQGNEAHELKKFIKL